MKLWNNLAMVQDNKSTLLNANDKARLNVRATEMLIGVGVFASFMHILVVVLLGTILSPAVDDTAVVIWVVVLSSFVASQVVLIMRKGGRPLGVDEAASVQRRYDLAALGVGLSWGAAGLVLFPESDPPRVFFLVFVMGGMSMSAVSTQHMNLRTCFFSILPGLPPLGLRYMLSDLPFNIISGGLLFAYAFVIANIAVRLHRFAHRAYALQIEQERLLEQLSKQAQALDLARASAEEANAAKSRFLAQASHDLRQPLHAISLFIESLPDARSPEEHDDIMKRVRQSLDILTKLFDSLLDVTLLDTGGMEINRIVFRPGDVIEEVKQDFSLVAEACNVELRSVQSNVAIDCDPVLVRRMLQNLISNAIRHSESGEVLIGCRRRNGKVSIAVVDSGRGIGEADREGIFGEFTRLDAARMGANASPGLGLGLSIVKRIAEKLDLNVRLSSEPGRGSVFEIDGFEISRTIPVDVKVQQAPVTSIVKGAKVFVLDDDIDTLAATALLLRGWGCVVETSQDWQDLMTAEPDVVICDYEISSEKTGLDVLAALAARNTVAIPAIIISGHTSLELRTDAAAQNIPLLHKPIRPAQLRSAILNALVVSGDPS